MGAGDDDRLGGGDEGLVDVALVERAVGAIVAIEDQRKGLVVAHAEQNQRGQPRRIGVNAGDVDAFAGALLADEAAHVLVADAGDEPALEAEPRRADGDVGRAAADRLGEARHVFEAAADLGAVEVDGRAADGDEVKYGSGQSGHLLAGRRGARRFASARPRRRPMTAAVFGFNLADGASIMAFPALPGANRRRRRERGRMKQKFYSQVKMECVFLF